MPLLNEWGLHPAGLAGPHENPVVVAPFPVASTDIALGAGAGRQASLEAGGSGIAVQTPHGAPEASSPGACEARPQAIVDGGTQLVAPEAGASEASAGHREVVPYCSSQLGAPKAGRLGTSLSAPRAGPHVEHLGRFRVDFAALRKRKESSSCSGRTFRPLKHRKYIAIDE